MKKAKKSIILKTVDYALGKGLTVNVYLEDWSNGYRDNRD
jgi:D-citramalate synthase